MNKFLIILFVFISFTAFTKEVTVSGELKALDTSIYSPPRIKNIWQYTISFMAENGSVVQPGMPVLMFKTDTIQTKLVDSKGKFSIKQSELKNKQVNKVETFANKNLAIEEKKMELEKAKRKADLPKSVIAKNEYEENKLNFQLAQKDFAWAQKDERLTRQKIKAEESILQAKINKHSNEVKGYQDAIKKMNLFASKSGVVIHQSNWSGNKFSVGDSVWNGQRVIEVADLTKIIAQLEINENQIKDIKLGQKVKIILDSLPDKEFFGTIDSIASVVRTKSKEQPAKILDATVKLDKVDSQLMRPGMRLSGKISVGDGS
jgi:HlyD family secretion protein